MPFPSVVDAATGIQGSNTATHSLGLPATVAENDVLLVFFSVDGNPTVTWDNTTAGTWSVLTDLANGTSNKLVIRWKRADGTEGGKTLSVTTSVTEQSVYRAVAVRGAHLTVAPEVLTATGTSTSPDPPNLAPSLAGVGVDTLWFAVFGNDDGRRSMSVIPSGFGNEFYDTSNGPAGVGLGTARSEQAVSSLNPTAFTISSSHTWVAATVGVVPAPYVPPPPGSPQFFAFF
jgi:hypothetical protein